MELMFFIIIYKYKPELIRDTKNIKIIIEKINILIF